MDFKEILELINRFEQSPSIMNLEAQISGDSLKLSKEPQNTPRTDSTPVLSENKREIGQTVESGETFIKAPLVGTFYAAAAPGDAPFATVGSKIRKGQTICIIEAMKVMNEIKAPCDGTVTSILVENEALVEYDQALMVIEENV